MGITICSKHGRQQIRFAAPAIAEQAELKVDATDDPILLLKVLWCDVWWVCPVHPNFFLENALNVPASGVLIVEDEDRVDELFGKMSPVCSACLFAFIKDRAPAHIVLELKTTYKELQE